MKTNTAISITWQTIWQTILKLRTKRTTNFLVGGLIGPLFIACNEDNPPQILEARAQLVMVQEETDSTYTLSSESRGEVLIFQEDSVVTMTINLVGFLPNTVHAVHIHAGNCEQPGSHWNMNQPTTERFCNTRSLNLPWAKPLAGDVGNVSVGYDGSGSFTLQTDLWRINSLDDRDIVGYPIVIHEKYIDFTDECDPFHDHLHVHDNPKQACGTIEML